MKRKYQRPEVDVLELFQENSILTASITDATAEDVTEGTGDWGV